MTSAKAKSQTPLFGGGHFPYPTKHLPVRQACIEAPRSLRPGGQAVGLALALAVQYSMLDVRCSMFISPSGSSGGMYGRLRSARGFDNVCGLGHLIRRAMGHQQELVGLKGGLVSEHAVLGNADAEQPGAKGT